MAKQVGAHRFTGTHDNLCCYKMGEDYYLRRKSRLTGKMFWRRKCFAASRRSCDRFGKGNHYAAIVYKEFKKQKGMWAVLKTKAIALFKVGKDEQEVVKKLVSLAMLLQPVVREKYKAERRKMRRKRSILPQLFVSLPVSRMTRKRKVVFESG